MTASDLNQILEQDLASYNLVVQASQQDECLSVVLNRPAAEHLDYSAIAKILTERIKTLQLGEIHSLFLSSRVLGEYDVDWQTQFEFVSPSSPEQTIVQNPTVAETEVNENPNLSLTDENSADEVESMPTPDVETSPYANYCFISNKGLLTFQILPPDETLSKLIQFFHSLSDGLKADVLPLLERFFASAVISSTEQFELEVQQWFEQLTQLDKAQIRKASIWFSRYCFNPDKTMTQVMAVIAPEPIVVESPQEIANTEAETSKISTPKTTNKRPTQTNTSQTKQRISAPKWHPLALPIGWLIFTLVIITFAIGSFDSGKLTAAACKNTIGKPEYCRLAVQLVGAVTFQEVAQQYTTPMPQSIQEDSLGSCEIQGNIYAGKTLQEALGRKTPVLSSHGEEVLPGIFIVDVKQTNFKQPGEFVRTSCVMVNTGKHGQVVGSGVIPTNWPEQPFKGQPITQDTFRKTIGIFNILLALGAGTFFNAIGIYLASVWGLGIRVSSLETIYKAAFLLGTLESMIALIPAFSLFTSIALETLVLGLIGIVIKDFHVQWSDGSKMVAAGTITIIAVSYFLKIILFGMMAALVH